MKSRFPERRRRPAEKGLTLIELMIATAIIGTITGAIGAALSMSIRVLGPAALQGQLAAANDLLAVERQLGADAAQADCIVAGVQVSCPSGAVGSCLPGMTLCLSWCQNHQATSAVYSLNGAEVVRQLGGSSFVVARQVRSFSVSLGPNPPNQVNVTITPQRGGQYAPLALLPLPSPTAGDQC